MATQKKPTNKSRKPTLVPGDPPILVGGGGSTLVWINNSVFDSQLTAAQVTKLIQDHPRMAHPATPGNYRVFKCNFNTVGTTVKADDGVSSVNLNDIDPDRHHAIFRAA